MPYSSNKKTKRNSKFYVASNDLSTLVDQSGQHLNQAMALNGCSTSPLRSSMAKPTLIKPVVQPKPNMGLPPKPPLLPKPAGLQKPKHVKCPVEPTARPDPSKIPPLPPDKSMLVSKHPKIPPLPPEKPKQTNEGLHEPAVPLVNTKVTENIPKVPPIVPDKPKSLAKLSASHLNPTSHITAQPLGLSPLIITQLDHSEPNGCVTTSEITSVDSSVGKTSFISHVSEINYNSYASDVCESAVARCELNCFRVPEIVTVSECGDKSWEGNTRPGSHQTGSIHCIIDKFENSSNNNATQASFSTSSRSAQSSLSVRDCASTVSVRSPDTPAFQLADSYRNSDTSLSGSSDSCSLPDNELRSYADVLPNSDALGNLSELENSERSWSSSPLNQSDKINTDGSFSCSEVTTEVSLPCYSNLTPSDSLDHDCPNTSNTPVLECNDSLENDTSIGSSPDNANTCPRDKVFNIAKEIASSERVFCNALKLLNEDFRTFVKSHMSTEGNCRNENDSYRDVKDIDSATENDLNKILKYLPQLQDFSVGLLADFEARVASWETNPKIADVIVTKGPFLKLYSLYIREFEYQCSLLDEACAKSPGFSKAVRDFEASDQCRKLSVKHYMLKPVQRVPQYRLLLENYLRKLMEDSCDYHDAETALTVVDDVASHANDTIKQTSNLSQLLQLQRRLINGGVPPQQGVELIRPGRQLLRQGQLLKLCRSAMQPRYFILLSDALLYTSYASSGPSGALRLNCELPLEGMQVQPSQSQSFMEEFSIISTRRSFTVRARSERQKDEWLKALQDAIEDNLSRRSSFLSAKTCSYATPASNDLGKQAPIWVPDYRVTMCQQCTREFTLTFRRHHCRACGKVVCDYCSSNRAPLQYKQGQPDRVCDDCFETLQTKSDKGENGNQDTNSLAVNRASDLRAQFKRGIWGSNRTKSRRKPERLLEVCANDQGSQISGYLRRMVRRTWRLGWYVLKDRVLYEYRAPEDVCAQESLPVLGYAVQANTSTDAVDGIDANLIFRLTHRNQAPIIFAVEASHLLEKWLEVMQEAVVL